MIDEVPLHHRECWKVRCCCIIVIARLLNLLASLGHYSVNSVCTVVECQTSQYPQYFEHIIAILAPFWIVPLKIRLRSTLSWSSQRPSETNTAVQDRQRKYLLAVSMIYLISHRILCHLVIFWYKLKISLNCTK